jgi:dTMP kinase
MMSRFVAFEGGEGTGKTTQIKALSERLRDEGFEVVLTWEPGGTAVGERVRSILLDPNTGPLSAKAEALLYAATRAEHVEKVIRPALKRGAWVLCDRYWDASRAYQGGGRGLGLFAIDSLNQWATDSLYPDLVFFFHLDPSRGLERAQKRSQGYKDRLELEDLSFHQRVLETYEVVARLEPQLHVWVDAAQSVENISSQIWDELTKRQFFKPSV